jgi:hypothetical protein
MGRRAAEVAGLMTTGYRVKVTRVAVHRMSLPESVQLFKEAEPNRT